MNLQTKMPTTADEFLRWEGGREDLKYELVEGRVESRPRGETRAHNHVVSGLVFAISSQLDRWEFDVGGPGFCVLTSAGVRRPDVLVDRRMPETRGSDLAARHPTIIVEVLSPSSRERDLLEKVADYLPVPTLLHYAVFAQDEPKVWLWSRSATGGWSNPIEADGVNSSVELTRLGIIIQLAPLFGWSA